MAPAYFGWDIQSLHDCLHGGYGGEPPYHVVVYDADRMESAFGHDGLVRYCRKMLSAIDAGRRGPVELSGRSYYEELRATATAGEGETLLDQLMDTFAHAPATLELRRCDGSLVGRSSDYISQS